MKLSAAVFLARDANVIMCCVRSLARLAVEARVVILANMHRQLTADGTSTCMTCLLCSLSLLLLRVALAFSFICSVIGLMFRLHDNNVLHPQSRSIVFAA